MGQKITRNVTVVTPVSTTSRTVTLAPGQIKSIEQKLQDNSESRTAPGTYTVRVTSNGSQVATTNYTVTGDNRIFSTIAGSGQYSGGTGAGFGQAIKTAFGNLNLLLGAMIVLICVMTIGGITATFTQVIHARRRTIGIYRATGASSIRIIKTIIGDVLRFAIPSTVFALIIAFGLYQSLRYLGYLTVFGVRAPASAPLIAFVLTLFTGILLAVISALLASMLFLQIPPRNLLSEGGIEPPEDLKLNWREGD